MGKGKSAADLTSLSKYLSYILRHQPSSIGLPLDAQGWARVDDLIAKTTAFELDVDLLRVVVECNDKQRFALSDNLLSIRANQGHSIDIDLALQPQQPPTVLLHGTAERFISAIQTQGLTKRKRHHVHLSESRSVAEAVGRRYGKSVVLNINAAAMAAQGTPFYLSANRVWLVDYVAPEFIQFEFT